MCAQFEEKKLDTWVSYGAQPHLLHSAYPLGLESLGRYPSGLGKDSCEMRCAGFRFG